jgi:hypothetical protein
MLSNQSLKALSGGGSKMLECICRHFSLLITLSKLSWAVWRSNAILSVAKQSGPDAYIL